MSKEQIAAWINRFKDIDTEDNLKRQQLVDAFINSIYLYDDRMIITYNIKDGETDKITLDDIQSSDLERYALPKKKP